eukprot:Nitzschia sp. Nitz4//scaffold5_size260463//72803//75526//NITZ4_000963-RA/size260463-processed-gene-0.306-mRNA-1//1//CDS//3329555283//8532//frame0
MMDQNNGNGDMEAPSEQNPDDPPPISTVPSGPISVDGGSIDDIEMDVPYSMHTVRSDGDAYLSPDPLHDQRPDSPGPPVENIGITRQDTDDALPPAEHMSLLELGEETMAQAMLIFLLSDLRILSATGRIRTKFEHLTLDSDRSPRLTSRDFAGFYDYEEANGVTASHIMALLLVEILQEAEDVARHKRRKHPALLSPWVSSVDGVPPRVNARKVFKRNVKAANGLPSLLHCYNEMLSEDVNPRISKVSRAEYPLDEDLYYSDQERTPLRSTKIPDGESFHDASLLGDDLDLHEQEQKYRFSFQRQDSDDAGFFYPHEPSAALTKDGESTIDKYGLQLPNLPAPIPQAPRRAHSLGGGYQSSTVRPVNLQNPGSPQAPPPIPAFARRRSNSISVGQATSTSVPQPAPRVASSSFQPAHFNPNIDSDEEDNDSVGRLKDIRERMEKAIPDKLANRVQQFNTQLKQNLPKSPAARQHQEMEEIAAAQAKLLRWEDVNASTSHASVEGRILAAGLANEVWGDLNASTKLDENAEVKNASKNNTTTTSTRKQTQYHDTNTIRQLILQALEKRDFWRLGFIKSFFREGTVSHVLANSGAEMVWLSDWHTQYECTYALSIDREKRKVLLAFRGAYTESDWRHIVDWYDTATSNPVKEHYPNRATNIRLHAGFHKYLFRVRKDTGTTKYDEIAAKLAHYCDVTGHNTRITITGHSLGAALATIFSLYASTEERFTKSYGAIECVTFGAPCIGNWRFAGAVKHQETVGKLRIAKFHVKGDSVPHLPPALFRTSSRGAQYWQSGIDVSLPYIRRGKFFKTFLGGQPKPKLSYWDPEAESYFGSLFRQFREYYLWNLPLRVWRFALFHTLVEHKKRMALVDKSDPHSLLANCSLKELYDMREKLTKKALRKSRGRTK